MTDGGPVSTGRIIVHADAVAKRYGGVTALADVNFSAAQGEVHALLGENGAGKSTFIKILTGAVKPDSGVVTIGGEPFTNATPAAARQQGIASVFQELSLVPDFTGAENIWIERQPRTRLRTLSASTMLRDAQSLLDELGFSDIPLNVPVRRLTVAQRQLIEIAKAVRGNPRVLILDEATSALAPTEAGLVLEMARRRAAQGALVIFISHRLAEVRMVADRITIFRNGHTVGTFETAAVSDDEVITTIIGRRVEHLYPPRTPCEAGEVVLSCSALSGGTRLKSVDLELRCGEVVGVGGLQGQGQLELFLRLFGAMPGGGEIRINGRPVRIRSPRAALRAGIGCALIPEDRHNDGLLLTKSVRENLSLARLSEVTRAGLVRPALERKLAARTVQELSIALDDPAQPVNTLSGGNQQKVVIGKFLYPDIEILLCYDPTRGVDVGAKRDIFQLLYAQADRGRAVLFFSTDLQELIHVPDRVVVMAGGEVTARLAREEVSDEAVLKAAFAVPQGVSA